MKHFQLKYNELTDRFEKLVGGQSSIELGNLSFKSVSHFVSLHEKSC